MPVNHDKDFLDGHLTNRQIFYNIYPALSKEIILHSLKDTRAKTEGDVTVLKREGRVLETAYCEAYVLS